MNELFKVNIMYFVYHRCCCLSNSKTTDPDSGPDSSGSATLQGERVPGSGGLDRFLKGSRKKRLFLVARPLRGGGVKGLATKKKYLFLKP